MEGAAEEKKTGRDEMFANTTWKWGCIIDDNRGQNNPSTNRRLTMGQQMRDRVRNYFGSSPNESQTQPHSEVSQMSQ